LQVLGLNVSKWEACFEMQHLDGEG